MRAQRLRRWLIIVMVGIIMAFPVLSWTSWGNAPELGVRDGQLTPCPDTPNAVCSQADDAQHQIDPLQFEGDPGMAMSRLEEVLRDLPRTKIVEVRPDYLRAECTTAWLRFVDDIEFALDASDQVIHVRSASRVGYSDLGANRERVELIRSRFQETSG